MLVTQITEKTERESTIYITDLFMKHTAFIIATERQLFHWKMHNTQSYSPEESLYVH